MKVIVAPFTPRARTILDVVQVEGGRTTTYIYVEGKDQPEEIPAEEHISVRTTG